ncbi:helix-turn-helix domain-containing protein [Streptomyces anulatus]|uniref:helix-turn-helix domain-containing protein n=1 Tax=Streptomyces anulatus TaxID=1892 RepID=UPI003657AD3E
MDTAPTALPSARLVRVDVAAEILSVKRSTAYEEIRLGRLRTVQIGRCRRIPTEYIEEYINLLKREASATF